MNSHSAPSSPPGDARVEGSLLSLHGISKQFPGVIALSDVSMEFRAGEVHALVGENGAGKSTLIKLLCGLYQPTRGRVLVHGLDVREWDPQALRRQIGVIFQDFNRYQFTVGENIGAGDVQAFDSNDAAFEAVNETKARRVASLAEMAAQADIVLLSLPGGPAVEAVSLGANGLTSGARKPQVIVDLSTTTVASARMVGEKLAAMGVALKDAKDPATGEIVTTWEIAR